MDIYKILKHDHQEVLGILEKLEKTSSGAVKTREKQLAKLEQELIPHMLAEESFFYPHLLDRTKDKQERETILEGEEEHHAARSVLQDLKSVSFDDEHWHPDLKVLKELISHHIDEEESEIFELAENIIEDADEVGTKFQETKQKQKAKV